MSNFVTYNSSAGSGKTFTLVKEYLKIALASDNPNNYRQILAITFTNKAAAEMKERVLGALIALSSGKPLEGTPKHLQDALVLPKTDGGLEISPETIQKRSEAVLQSVLHNYNDFGISTIDKFTHKIVRTFAHDLQLPMNFNVELEEEDVLKASIDLLINEVGTNEKLTQVLTEYALQKSDEEKNWSVDYDLLDFAKKLLKEDGEKYLEKVRQLGIEDFEKIKVLLQKETNAFDQQLKGLAKEVLAYIEQKGIEPSSFSSSFYPNYWKKILSDGGVEPTATMQKKIAGEGNWYAAKVDEHQKGLIDNSQQELTEKYEASRELIDEQYSDYLVNNKLLQNLYNLAVLNEIEKALLEFKQENNILNISDFNKKIAGIVSSEPAPFIYERLGEKYEHYLIDEFQDTSVMQWHNLLPLVDNSLAKGSFNMVVGDAKQAIYRWRGGEVEQLLKFPKVYGHNKNPILLERQDSLERNYKCENLSKNYRSKSEIVDFNNKFFNQLSVHLSDDYKSLYADLKQEFSPKNKGGGVEIIVSKESDNQLFKDFNLKYIFNTIENCKKDGYNLSDIAILTRGKDEGKEIAAYLLEQNIAVISAESLLLISSKEVCFLVDLIRHLSQRSHLGFQIKLLNYLVDKMGGDLFEITKANSKDPLTHFLKEHQLELTQGSLSHYNLYELCEHMIKHFGLDHHMNIYLQFFLDKVHEYASKNDQALPNFLEWWDKKAHKFTIVIPEGVNAVQVMTIHKSKGLEFPVVIFPFANKQVKTSESFFWTDNTGVEKLNAAIVPLTKSLLETRFAANYQLELEKSKLDLVNLMYVAFTRPKDRLYIVSRVGKTRSQNGSMGDYLNDFCLSNETFAPETGLLRIGPFVNNQSTEDQNIEGLELKQTGYHNWRERLRISFQAPQVWDVESPQRIGEYGTLLHSVLAKIKSVNDVDHVLNGFELKGVINSSEKEDISVILKDLFAQNAVRHLFEDVDELMNERTILLPGGKAYQPDRVVVKGDTTYLVDFKTGAKEAKHEKQLLDYRNLLIEMGYENVEPYLLYTQEGSLEKV